jgi:hypothetical protein
LEKKLKRRNIFAFAVWPIHRSSRVQNDQPSAGWGFSNVADAVCLVGPVAGGFTGFQALLDGA